MAVSLAEIIIIGLIVDFLFRRLKVPGLVGMLFLGVVFGPYVLGLLDSDLLTIAADLRLMALVVILLRAGFELSRATVARVGKTALLLSFVPAVLEGLAVTLVAPTLLGLTTLEAAILGSVLAAVSPAVVVPLMIRFIRKRMGAVKGIPTLLLAASSIDDVFVIVVYGVLIGIYAGHSVNIGWQLAGIPLSIVLGIVVGLGFGYLLYRVFDRFNPRATKRMLTILALSVLLVRVENLLEGIIPFAALLAVMSIGFIILEKREKYAHELSMKFGKLWVFAEIILFTLVGSQVNVQVAWKAGLAGAAVIAIGLLARSIGTYLCVLSPTYTFRERIFIVISYLPKATVQAAIGGAPLAMMKATGMSTIPGEVILAVAVLSIILTAPLGAWAITVTGNHVLRIAPPEYSAQTEAARESEAASDL